MIKFSLFKNYQTKPIKKLFDELSSGPEGLGEKEARKRIKVFGKNQIVKKKKAHPLMLFLKHFKDPFVLILIAAATISGFVGEFKSASIIIIMVVLSVSLNFYQEYKSNRAAEKLAKKMALTATVIRAGKKQEIPAKFLVPGDMVEVSAGEIIPADGRLITADDFFVNEAALTGESFPREKVASEKSESHDGTVFSGTSVVSGSADFLVIRTGSNTEVGKIAEEIAAPEPINAFEAGIKNFGYLIVRLTFLIVIAIFLINAILKHDIFQSLIFAIAVAVGLTPELLPMILSINMARGAVKMSRHGVIVKRLNAIPDFGSMDILCTDKTGTLTEDKITVVKYLNIFGQTDEMVLRQGYLNAYFETGLKSPLEQAILNFKEIDIKKVRKVDEIPYDFLRKRLSVVIEERGNRIMITKGAPEGIIKICSSFIDKGNKTKIFSSNVKNQLMNLYDGLSEQGFRVLAVAIKDVIDDKKVYPASEEDKMTFSGVIAFYDPPKIGVKDTLKFMQQHGIEIKIITGDNPLVTKKVCHDLKLPVKGVLTGEEAEKLSDEALAVKAKSISIFARFLPQQKDHLITTLKKQGLVVGYLGDGINDAPPLKSADVGISVSNAVDVAREAADIILVNKSLKELMEGVIEGRKTFGNTMKYMMMGLSSNFGNMFSLIGAALFLPFLPMLPSQILLNNFLYDLSQFTIPLDNVDQEYLMKPKHWRIEFIQKFMYVFGPISSLFDFLTFYLLYAVFHLTAAAFQTGWFIESLATQVLVIYLIRTNRFILLASRPNKFLIISTLSVVLIGILLPFSLLGQYFGFIILPTQIIFAILTLVLVYLIIVEAAKHIFYRRLARP